MNKKFTLVDKGVYRNGRHVYRIKALKSFGDVEKDDLGGFVQSELNLSQDGECWIYDDATVYGCGRIYDNAKLYDNSEVCDYAEVYDNVALYNNAKISGGARVFNSTTMYGSSSISGFANVCGCPILSDNASVSGHSQINGPVEIKNNAKVFGFSFVSGETEITDNAQVCGHSMIISNMSIGGDARLDNNDKFISVSNFDDGLSYSFYLEGNKVMVSCDYFSGTAEDFRKTVIDKFDNPEDYLALVDLMELRIEKRKHI